MFDQITHCTFTKKCNNGSSLICDLKVAVIVFQDPTSYRLTMEMIAS